jgi:uncharacterized NAD-dependent epimerase/dehydratase family protein
MSLFPEGNAIVYCEEAFKTPNGKTAHGLVRGTRRYRVMAVVDSTLAGQDAGQVLEGKPCSIPIVPSIETGIKAVQEAGEKATHLVIGLAPDGGRLEPDHRRRIKKALELGLNLDSGLHDFLSEDPELSRLAAGKGLTIRDVRKPPERSRLHFFQGKIEEVDSLKLALLGTDSALGKRTTALILTQALNQAGLKTQLIGTGQTSWMQGVEYGLILDSLVNDFVAGEIEHAVWSAWKEAGPKVIVIEGQGSLLNPAYPGGFEILAAGRPEAVILQHAPARQEYDGFPGYPIHPLERQIKALEIISGKPVAAITLNHEGLRTEEVPRIAAEIEKETGLPCLDVLLEGPGRLVRLVSGMAGEKRNDQG